MSACRFSTIVRVRMYCVIQKYVSNLCQSSVFQPYVCVYVSGSCSPLCQRVGFQRYDVSGCIMSSKSVSAICVGVPFFNHTCVSGWCHPNVCQRCVSNVSANDLSTRYSANTDLLIKTRSQFDVTRIGTNSHPFRVSSRVRGLKEFIILSSISPVLS